MIRLALLGLAIVIYGQLFFNAVSYYFQISHPSWGVWIFLYSAIVWIALKNTYKTDIKISNLDVYFLVFMMYLIMNFILIGESDFNTFFFRVAFVCIGPYFIGRVIGSYVGPSLLKNLKLITLFYLVLVVFEIAINPSLFFDTDRLRLWAFVGEQSDNGVGTAYLLGITMGSMWVVAFVYSTWKKKEIGTNIKYGIFFKTCLLIIPFVILSIGSRSSLAAMFGSAITLSFIASLLFHKKKVGGSISTVLLFLSLIIIGIFVYIYILPDSRKELLTEIYSSLSLVSGGGSSKESCLLEGSSISIRMVLMSEAARLFGDAPFFGVGASNYGWYYCGIRAGFVSPHSSIAQVLAELGIVGFGLFSLLLIEIVRKFINRVKSRAHSNHIELPIMFSLWIFMLLQTQITGNIFSDYHFFLLTGLLISNLKHLPLPMIILQRQSSDINIKPDNNSIAKQ
jgi:O-antigen ligase